MINKKIYRFGKFNDSSLDHLTIDQKREILGNKGCFLHNMSAHNFPIPAGLIISADECMKFLSGEGELSEKLQEELKVELKKLEEETGLKLGCKSKTLLLSVRSGSKISMPGMMDTVLNLGINKNIIDSLKKQIGEYAALDSHRRFIEMYGSIVFEIPQSNFLEASKSYDISTTAGLEKVINAYDDVLGEHKIPEDPYEQVCEAIKAVFTSWLCQRAITYRQMYNIPSSLGTAVILQRMIFGNKDEQSCSGVVFSRNPVNGKNHIYGEYLTKSQGEDIVAGTHTPSPISSKQNKNELDSLERSNHSLFEELSSMAKKIEAHFEDMQDIEFTVESGVLWILQSRSGKRSAKASVVIAHDMVKEGIASKGKAIMKINADNINNLLHSIPSEDQDIKEFARGLPASPGVAVGYASFDNEYVKKLTQSNKKAILVRQETSPDDIAEMKASEGILTATGGMTSHAAVVARGMGKTCIVGCDDIIIDEKTNSLQSHNGESIQQGELISIDGCSGKVYKGEIKTDKAEMPDEFLEVLKWTEEFQNVDILANAETISDIETAKKFFAQGIGLCRTEHMFFSPDKIDLFRSMVLTQDRNKIEEKCLTLGSLQEEDFFQIFRKIDGLPITIRLLDPPLHEFLPKQEKDIKEFMKKSKLTQEEFNVITKEFHEYNPMLGFRGVRLGIVKEAIYKMQLRAIFGAYINASQNNYSVNLKIMIPLVIDQQEVICIKNMAQEVSQEMENRLSHKITYQIGTMIESPRACILADKIADNVDFFSFGTNDLTQMTMGISRDDYESFFKKYQRLKIFENDPFVVFDQEGVGALMQQAIEKARTKKPDLHISVCGEHAGEIKSSAYFIESNVDALSCSPFRIPAIKIAAAQQNIMKATKHD